MLFSHRSESPEPHTAESPAWGALASGRGALRAFNFEGQQGLIAGAPQVCEIETSLSKGTHKISCNNRTQGKSSHLIGAWVSPTCWSWRVSWRSRRGASHLALLGARGSDSHTPEPVHPGISAEEVGPEGPSLQFFSAKIQPRPTARFRPNSLSEQGHSPTHQQWLCLELRC